MSIDMFDFVDSIEFDELSKTQKKILKKLNKTPNISHDLSDVDSSTIIQLESARLIYRDDFNATNLDDTKDSQNYVASIATSRNFFITTKGKLLIRKRIRYDKIFWIPTYISIAAIIISIGSLALQLLL